MKNTDESIVTMYDYIERSHIWKFIHDRVQINLYSFMSDSKRPNDYQGISISGGSSIEKTRNQNDQ